MKNKYDSTLNYDYFQPKLRKKWQDFGDLYSGIMLGIVVLGDTNLSTSTKLEYRSTKICKPA